MSVEEEDRQDVVLLVDDNPTNLQVLYQTLGGRDYRLLAATNGEDALSVVDKAHPDLVLLDIMMPGIDGLEVCRRMKANPESSDIVVIFLSALDDAEDKVKGLSLGAVDYIGKPFHTEEVTARVETHLKLRRLERNLARRNAALEAANQRMTMDLEAAARVQQAQLPRTLPEVEQCRFTWLYLPCDELGGDGLNIFRIDDRHMGIYILDVAGHGVPSALLAVTVSRGLLPTADRTSLVTKPADNEPGYVVTPPSEVASYLNRMYPMAANSRLYFTLLYAVLDTEECTMTFVTAGIPGPVLVRPGEAVQVHDAPAVPIGLLEDSDYEDTQITLQPGDRIYMHSDGLVEERNASGEMFGRERLSAALDLAREVDLEASINGLVDQVVSWKGDDRFRDDVSLVAFELCED